MNREGLLVSDQDLQDLRDRFNNVPTRARQVMREVAAEADGELSLNHPTLRRVGAARILLELAEHDGWFDKDLVRCLCEQRTGKKYNTAGEALAAMEWYDVEAIWLTVQSIYAETTLLEYHPESNNYTIKEKTS
jgi:hypothetical protein